MQVAYGRTFSRTQGQPKVFRSMGYQILEDMGLHLRTFGSAKMNHIFFHSLKKIRLERYALNMNVIFDSSGRLES